MEFVPWSCPAVGVDPEAVQLWDLDPEAVQL